MMAVEAQCSGEFGVALLSGELSCGRIEISGGRRPVVVNDATLRADQIMISNQGLEALTVGQSGRLYGTSVDTRTGSLVGQRPGFRSPHSCGSSGPPFVPLDHY